MNVYKHIVYNPHITSLQKIISDAQQGENGVNDGLEWQFMRSQPVTEYEWVAIFEKWDSYATSTKN